MAAGLERITGTDGHWDYSDEAYDTFPRYRILAAIQNDVEQFVPPDFQAIADLRDMLVTAIQTAEVDGKKFESAVAAQAVEDERRLFLNHIQTIDEARLTTLPPLPFRRVLSADEHKRLHAQFRNKWGNWYGGYVIPEDSVVGTITLHDAAMEHAGAYEHLRLLLANKGISRVVELREYDEGYELDLSAARFLYDLREGFWMSGEMSWMVYASHESSITFGGDWLIEGMRRFLPDFNRLIYRGWDLSAYPSESGDSP